MSDGTMIREVPGGRDTPADQKLAEDKFAITGVAGSKVLGGIGCLTCHSSVSFEFSTPQASAFWGDESSQRSLEYARQTLGEDALEILEASDVSQ